MSAGLVVVDGQPFLWVVIFVEIGAMEIHVAIHQVQELPELEEAPDRRVRVIGSMP